VTPRIEVPAAARWVVETLESAGFETWTVGGGVRDALLGATSVDWDFATAARPRDVQRVFRRTVPVGIEHGTVGVLGDAGTLYEVTTFRKDVETDGRHAVVTFADRIEDDLARRDFTINAVAWHPVREELLDPFGGEADLRDRRLRTVGEPSDRFAEDYLRILRGLRFAGRLAMDIDRGTWDALVAAVDGLGGLSAERIREEWVKMLGTADPRGGLELYRESGALARVAPPLADASPPAWEAALQTASAVSADEPILRTVALFEVARADVRSTLARGVATWMRGLRFSNADTDRAVHLLASPAELPPLDAPAAAVRRWLAAVGPDRAPDRFTLVEASIRTRGAGPDADARLGAVRDILAAAPPLRVEDLAIGGRELIRLGLKPGPHFGELLEALLDRVLDDPSLNTPDALLAEVSRRPDAGEGGRSDDR
jgi:tRNA nucleotidyltransferase (CCA-adding enzyme)